MSDATPYQSLARKYRPALFRELVGQDAAAKALTTAIRLGRIPQGVLFTGVRGVGKTTTARLYAKALNCEERGDDAEPCNVCDSCVAIAKGSHEDVLEIDGASNNGVADVRALQETIAYVPQRSRYRVYIIDEVHMLSQGAFNALLKTLEEPPAHVVFVFATTELAKVPATIIGRCQTFHLGKLPVAVIRDRLAQIIAAEGLEAEDKALGLIAREGHGSMRDALTLLDQAIAIGGGHVTLASLGPIVSNLSSSPYLDLLDAFVARDPARGVAVIEELDAKGAVFVDVAEAVANFARHGFVIRDLGPGALDTALLGLDDDEVQRLATTAKAAGPLDLNRIFRTLVKCRQELDGSALDRYLLENYLFEWCLDPGLPDVEALLRGGGLQPPPPPGGGGGGGLRAPVGAGADGGARAPAGKSLREAFADTLKGAPAGAPRAATPQAEAPAASLRSPQDPSSPSASSLRGPAAPGPASSASLRGPAAPGPSASSLRGSSATDATSPSRGPSASDPSHPSASSLRGPASGDAPGPSRGPLAPDAPQPSALRGPSAGDTHPSASALRGPSAGDARGPLAPDAPQPSSLRGPTPGDAPHPSASSIRGPSAPDVTGPSATDSPPPSRGPSAAPPASPSTLRGAAAPEGPPRGPSAPSPSASDAPSASPASANTPLGSLPATWRGLVDAWKREKPLQARKLEDVHPIVYTPEQITLAVGSESGASRALLVREEQARLREHFQELFGFSGTLVVLQAEDVVRQGATTGPAEALLPETILTERAREDALRREKIREETASGAFAKEALAVLGGAIDDVAVRGPA